MFILICRQQNTNVLTSEHTQHSTKPQASADLCLYDWYEVFNFFFLHLNDKIGDSG